MAPLFVSARTKIHSSDHAVQWLSNYSGRSTAAQTTVATTFALAGYLVIYLVPSHSHWQIIIPLEKFWNQRTSARINERKGPDTGYSA